MSRRTSLALALAATVSSAAVAAPDGYLDPTFGQGGLRTVAFDLSGNNWDQAFGLATLPDGRILLAGVVRNVTGNGIGLARLGANGQIDNGFGKPWYHPGSVTDLSVADATAQPDGKLVVAGHAKLGESAKALVCRFRPDGSIDTGFATAQPNLLPPGCRLLTTNEFSSFNAVTVQHDGRIAMVGSIMIDGSNQGLIVRLDAQGDFDTDFNGSGVHVPPNLFESWSLLDIAQTPTGDLIAVGLDLVVTSDWQVLRLRGSDGALDDNFGDGGVKTLAIDHVPNGIDMATTVSVLPDGRIVIGGEARGPNSSFCPAVARLWPDGQPDESLGPNGVFLEPALCLSALNINDMLVQSDGRIVLAGSWNAEFFATRILPTGGIDPGFGPDLGFGNLGVTWFDFGPVYGTESSISYARRIASHAGRLLMAGYAQSGDESGMDFAIARLDNDLIYASDLE